MFVVFFSSSSSSSSSFFFLFFLLLLRTVRLADNGFELVFADGTVVGHRSMRRYYKQALRAPVQPQTADRRLTRRHREMGITTTSGVIKYQKAQRQMAKKAKAARHIQDKSEMRLGVKANKLQPHFRHQILM
jgi:pre-60S factor REI1